MSIDNDIRSWKEFSLLKVLSDHIIYMCDRVLFYCWCFSKISRVLFVPLKDTVSGLHWTWTLKNETHMELEFAKIMLYDMFILLHGITHFSRLPLIWSGSAALPVLMLLWLFKASSSDYNIISNRQIILTSSGYTHVMTGEMTGSLWGLHAKIIQLYLHN